MNFKLVIVAAMVAIMAFAATPTDATADDQFVKVKVVDGNEDPVIGANLDVRFHYSPGGPPGVWGEWLVMTDNLNGDYVGSAE